MFQAIFVHKFSNFILLQVLIDILLGLLYIRILRYVNVCVFGVRPCYVVRFVVTVSVTRIKELLFAIDIGLVTHLKQVVVRYRTPLLLVTRAGQI